MTAFAADFQDFGSSMKAGLAQVVESENLDSSASNPIVSQLSEKIKLLRLKIDSHMNFFELRAEAASQTLKSAKLSDAVRELEFTYYWNSRRFYHLYKSASVFLDCAFTDPVDPSPFEREVIDTIRYLQSSSYKAMPSLTKYWLVIVLTSMTEELREVRDSDGAVPMRFKESKIAGEALTQTAEDFANETGGRY
jgi:hypothetical protein